MPENPTGAQFQSTLWSDVLRAKDPQGADGRAALERLCATYWAPLYAYLRRKGRSGADAADDTQGFFAYLIEKGLVERAERERGRFRSYLLSLLEHWLANEYRKAHAAKRGGFALAIDVARAEQDIGPDPGETPDAAFTRMWGMSVLKQAFDLLRAEFERRRRPGEYEVVCGYLQAETDDAGYASLASRLQCSVTDVRNLLYATRRRLRELIRGVLRETVETEEDVDTELRALFAGR